MKIGGINLTNQYQCIGCGAFIQSENKDQMGYLPKSAFEKGLAKGEFYCQRCFRMRHYNEVQDLQIDDNVFLDKLNEIASDHAFVILVVDIFDVEGSIISGLSRFIGQQPFIVAANKFDLLPKVTRKSKVKDWIRQIMNRHQLYPQDVILTYGSKASGIEELVAVIEKEILERNIYIVGVTNVGKSTLINQLIFHFGGEKEVITTSNQPGTTLDMIEISLTENHSVYDTPGIIRRNQLAHYLSREDLIKVLPSKPIKPKTFQLKGPQTLFLAGLTRIDIQQAETESCAVTLYVDRQLYIHRTKTEKADGLYQEHLGDLLSPPSAGYKDEFPELVAKDFRIQPKQDINISGLGWLTVNETVNIRVWLPKAVSVSRRPSII